MVILSGMETAVSDSQPQNASGPIEVTPSGIETEVSDSQPENALAPIEVTPSGMTILPSHLGMQIRWFPSLERSIVPVESTV